MEKPPRDKKENIMTRDCMIWLNFPHVCSQAAMVIAVLVTAMYMHTGLIQQSGHEGIETLCEYMTDDTWADWNGDDCLEAISCPYYCMCKRWTGSQWETFEDGTHSKPWAIWTDDGEGPWVNKTRPAIIRENHFKNDGEDPTFLPDELQPMGWTIDEWIGRRKYDVVFRTDDVPPWPLSTMMTGKSLHVSEGVQIVPGFIAAGEPPQANFLLSHGYTSQDYMDFKASAKKLDETNCMMEGLTLGRSVSFITAVMCEMLRAYTVRSLAPATSVWNRTWAMHFACITSFLLTVSLTLIPGVKKLFALGTPDWFYYGVAFVFALGSMGIDELSKFAYRRVLVKREAGDTGARERRAIMDQLDILNTKISEADSKNQGASDAMKKIAELLEKDGANKINLTI
jgi:hypothetical protein